MPSPPSNFQPITQPPQTFSDYLKPRAIDDPMPPASGWENGPTAGGELALGFLKGIRQNRLAQAQENDQNTQTQLDNFRAHVNSRLADPDLTDEGRQAISQQAHDIMASHAQYEMRDVPKHGVAGFFKNLLVNATGGPIKQREPINWNEATGKITNAAAGHSQKANYQKILNDATMTLQKMRESGNIYLPSDYDRALADHNNQVALQAPAYAKNFSDTIKLLTPGDPMAEEMSRAEAQELRKYQQRSASTAAPPATAPPEVDGNLGGDGSPVSGAAPGQADDSYPEYDPSQAGGYQPGQKVSYQGKRLVLKGRSASGEWDAVAAPQADPSPAAKLQPPADPAQGQGGPSAVPPTAAPPSAGFLADTDLRNPVHRQLLAHFGYKPAPATTLYNPKTWDVMTNMVQHPVTGVWEKQDSGKKLTPEQQDLMVPENQVKGPAASEQVVVSGQEKGDDGKYLPPSTYIVDKPNNRVIEVGTGRVVKGALYGAQILDLTGGPNGNVYTPRSDSAGAAGPNPQETAAQKHRDAITAAADTLAGEARRLNKDPQAVAEYIRNYPGATDEVRNRAYEMVKLPKNDDAELLNTIINGPSNTAPVTAAPPAGQVPVVAPKVVTPGVKPGLKIVDIPKK